MKDALIFLVIICFIAGSFFIGRFAYHKCENSTTSIIDTVTITNTIVKPQPYKVYIRDTVHIYDTIKLYLDTLTKGKDTVFIKASVSNNALDTLQAIWKYEPIIIEKNRSRWGVGIQSGVGFGEGGKITPYIGVGISYRLFEL